MKTCNKCKENKLLSDYHKDSGKKDGLCTICKECKRANTKAWILVNPERAKQNALASYHRRRSDPEFKRRMAENGKKWREKNRDKHCAKEARRRSSKLNATPSWLADEHQAHMQRTYKLCAIVSDATGKKYHVDHIVPLQGKNVCGLHVPWNLRVIPAEVNLSKGNKL